MYTTTNGMQRELNPKLWKGIKRVARSRMRGESERLFNSAWRQYRAWLRGAIDDPENIDDVVGWLESIIAEKVNNPKSSFYIYG